ncbi:basic leucine zipper 6 [Cornus florida]|uniref:basic leucine zipper 6 n=1 Tax=Cornus florida TaxID=4283 RepID=UPI002899EB7A|nr:basic leucine zipper 6 [Cornus florida]XP_059628528.1 basic leucine zipper 6 [Cornus florida]
MSRQAHLPPRCPFQKKAINNPIHDHDPPTLFRNIESYPRHHKSISQSYILEEQPAWLDDLLSDSDSNSKGIFHRRSASDSVTLLDGLVPLPSLTTLNDDNKSCSNEAGSGLESACVYGPNSPRGKLNFPENGIISALSEYVSENPMQYLDGDICVSRTPQLDSAQDARGSTGEINADTKAVKRHSGQRSRVRKLQYIAELERTVDVFQTLESELAVRVDSLLQQRTALSVENSKLKQQVARLQREKLIVDGRYKSLRKEMDRLKICLAYAPSSKVSTNFRSSHAAEAVSSVATWQMLEFGKLDLN